MLAKAKIAASASARVQSEVEDWAVEMNGLRGRRHVVRRGLDSASALYLGPFVNTSGTWHNQHWHQTDNGVTVLDQPQPSQTEKLTAHTLERVNRPLDAYLVTSTYESGHVVRAFYDPKTFALLRNERLIAGRTYFTQYEDFRSDDRGRARYWHYFGGSDRPEDAFDDRLKADAVDGPVEESEVAVPHDRRTLVEFPAGQHTVRLPARIERGRIYVRVTVGKRGLDLLLDSGASGLALSERVAKELHLDVRGRVSAPSGSYDRGRVLIPQMNIGPLVMRDVVMTTEPIDDQENFDTRVVGLLGFDFIAGAALRIDYEHGTVEATMPSAFEAPPGAHAVPVVLNRQQPYIELAVDGASGKDFVLDTGATNSLLLLQRFVSQHQSEPELAVALKAADTRGTFIRIIGGRSRVGHIALSDVRLAGFRLNLSSALVSLERNAFGVDTQDGILGAEVLGRFNLYLDYANHRVLFEPNSYYSGLASRRPGAGRTAPAPKPARNPLRPPDTQSAHPLSRSATR